MFDYAIVDILFACHIGWIEFINGNTIDTDCLRFVRMENIDWNYAMIWCNFKFDTWQNCSRVYIP